MAVSVNPAESGIVDPKAEARRVAYHEAGHAVFCYLLRTPVRQISITPDDVSLGRVSPTDWAWVASDHNDGTLSRMKAETVCMILLAGCCAEARFLRRPRARLPLGGGERDYAIAAQVVADQCGDHDEMNAYLRWLTCRTRNALAVYWEMVELVALQLLDRSTISGEAMRKLCRQVGPAPRWQ